MQSSGAFEFEEPVLQLATALRARGWRMATAESCTGGLIAAACTAVAGSSDWFECGWVTYSNAAKTRQLAVPPALLQAHGAVSEPVARAMVLGALQAAPVNLAVAVTGIAGPGGAVPGKPVGTVWLAWGIQTNDKTQVQTQVQAQVETQMHSRLLQLPGDRSAVRQATVLAALQVLLQVSTQAA
jgi:nicotinamide-nucleotide amidase